jgi:CheY-like chemotaxis protein/anti-sigma regulatory factor (Ser/Thr protein kinase)
MNLCTNAAHAMEADGGILTVRLKDVILEADQIGPAMDLKPGHFQQLTVSDTGTGMAPEIMANIFDPYFTTKEVGKGTGMGLSLVHGIVDAYKGKIFVESQIGKGTTFTIYWPVAESKSISTAAPSPPIAHGSERILLIADEPSIIHIVGRLLERLGYTVSAHTSSTEALAQFRQNPADIDLVITDLSMPNMNGDQLASALKAIRPDIPIIVCTGHSDWVSQKMATMTDIRGYIYKPVVKAELAAIVRRALDGQSDGLHPADAPSHP